MALTYSFLDSRECEFYIERRGWVREVIVERMAYACGAEKCFSCLVNNNVELLEKKIDVGTIEDFVQHIRNLGPDADFLFFMKSCCSVAFM